MKAMDYNMISFGISGSGSSRYAQIDIAATETAHKVGTQHAQCREERLQELEQKKKGAQQWLIYERTFACHKLVLI